MDNERHYRVKIVSHTGIVWYVFSVSPMDNIQLTNNVDLAKAFTKINECERVGALKVEREPQLKEWITEMI